MSVVAAIPCTLVEQGSKYTQWPGARHGRYPARNYHRGATVKLTGNRTTMENRVKTKQFPNISRSISTSHGIQNLLVVRFIHEGLQLAICLLKKLLGGVELDLKVCISVDE